MKFYIFFEGIAKNMKFICAIILLVLIGRFLLGLGMAAYEMSPLALDDRHMVEATDDFTKFVNQEFGNIHSKVNENIIEPTTEFPKSLPHTFAGIYFFDSLLQIPIIILFWWIYTIFSELSSNPEPYRPVVYFKLKKIGALCIWFGLLYKLSYSLLLQFFVVGYSDFTDPINISLVLFGFVLMFLAGVLEHRRKLQME